MTRGYQSEYESGRFRARFGLLLLGLTLISCFGCVRQDGRWEEESDPSCPATPTDEMAVELVTWIDPAEMGPITDIAALSESEVYLIGLGGRSLLRWAQESVGTIEAKWGGALVDVTKGREGIVVATETQLFRVSESDRFVTPLEVPLPDSATVWSVAETAQGLWVIVGKGDGFSLLHFPRDAAGRWDRSPQQHILSGASTITALSSHEVVLSEQSVPFRTSVWREGCGRLEASRVFEEALLEGLGEGSPASVYSIGAFPIGCGQVMQVLADLRSENRWFAFYETDSGLLLRQKKIVHPLGFVQALTDQHLLVGSAERPGGRYGVLGKWVWERAMPVKGGGS